MVPLIHIEGTFGETTPQANYMRMIVLLLVMMKMMMVK